MEKVGYVIRGKPAKDSRERLILLALVDLYIQSGRPVGSNTLKESEFGSLSSATIRNYFTKLEEQGFLHQPHTSGGRIPTARAFRFYAEHCLSQLEQGAVLGDGEIAALLEHQLPRETKRLVHYLQQAAEWVSEKAGCPVMISAPRFDQDFIVDIQWVPIDGHRCLCVVLTDFGMVHTELLHVEGSNAVAMQKLQDYCRFRLKHLERPNITPEEERAAAGLYNEVFLRHIVTYNHFSAPDLYRTGFAKLLHYPEFAEAALLAHALELFEDEQRLQKLLHVAEKKPHPSCWIGEEIGSSHQEEGAACAILAQAYAIQGRPVGAMALLGPLRIPYPQLLHLLTEATREISETLTRSLCTHKLTYRTPEHPPLEGHPRLWLEEQLEG